MPDKISEVSCSGLTDENVKCYVHAVDQKLEFNVQPTTTGKQLFDQVTKAVGLHEVWFFGLQYKIFAEHTEWLILDKKILKQIDASTYENPIIFHLRVKFYPEEIDELVHENTIRIFYLQVKEQILSDNVICPPKESILLASFAIQTKFGDFNEEMYNAGCLDTERLFSARLLRKFRLIEKKLKNRIVELWKDHKGMSCEEAMIEYLKCAQELSMYGISYFGIQNKKGAQIVLGVHSLGLNVYVHGNQGIPFFGFQWFEIHTISCNETSFTIMSRDKKSKDLVFVASHLRTSQNILSLCIGNYELYMRRHQSDMLEIKPFKQKIYEKQSYCHSEYDRSLDGSKTFEAQEQAYNEELEHMREKMQSKDREIQAAHEHIHRLECQIAELSMKEWKITEEELVGLNRQLRFERALNQDERTRLLDKIGQKEQEIDRMRHELNSRAWDANQLNHLTNKSAILNFDINLRENKSIQQRVSEASQRQMPRQKMLQPKVARPPSPDFHLENSVSIIRQKLELLLKNPNLEKNGDTAIDNDATNVHPTCRRRSILELAKSENTRRRIDQFENL